jgi:uroporphyrinogen-III synthase
VSQPEPVNGKSPYYELAEKNNLLIDFRPFIQVEGVSAKEIRKDKVNLLDYTAVIFTSRTGIDHYFRVAKEMRVLIPETMKYFCKTESVAHYLQKYIVYRKRKIFHGQQLIEDIMDLLLKNKDEKFLIPISDAHNDAIPELLKSKKLNFKAAVFYRTVSADLSDLKNVDYDMLIFYSPSGIKSLLTNFPNFDQKEIRIASFGKSTAQAVREAGLRLDIEAPLPEAPSMTMAVEQYINQIPKKTVKK